MRSLRRLKFGPTCCVRLPMVALCQAFRYALMVIFFSFKVLNLWFRVTNLRSSQKLASSTFVRKPQAKFVLNRAWIQPLWMNGKIFFCLEKKKKTFFFFLSFSFFLPFSIFLIFFFFFFLIHIVPRHLVRLKFFLILRSKVSKLATMATSGFTWRRRAVVLLAMLRPNFRNRASPTANAQRLTVAQSSTCSTLFIALKSTINVKTTTFAAEIDQLYVLFLFYCFKNRF